MSDDIDAVVEEILVDAYGPDEQLWAFRQFFEDEATFPFPAEVVGAPVEVVVVDYDSDERRGLVARCRRDGRRRCWPPTGAGPASMPGRTGGKHDPNACRPWV